MNTELPVGPKALQSAKLPSNMQLQGTRRAALSFFAGVLTARP